MKTGWIAEWSVGAVRSVQARRRLPARRQKARRSTPKLFAAASGMVLVSLLVTAPARGGSSVTSPEKASFERCDDQANFFSVPMERVQIRDGDASNDRVPEAYTPRPDPPDKTVLAISELRCEKATVNGSEVGPVSMAFANIELTGAPEGSPDDAVLGDGYLLFFSTDSEPLADWLRAGTGLEAYYEPDISYNYTVPPEGEAPFDFKAPGPRRWAFTVTGKAPAQRQAPLRIGEGWAWQDKEAPDGRIWRTKFASLEHDNYAIFPVDMTVMPTPGSELHKIMLPEDHPPDEPYGAQDPFAASGFIPTWDVVKTRTIIRP